MRVCSAYANAFCCCFVADDVMYELHVFIGDIKEGIVNCSMFYLNIPTPLLPPPLKMATASFSSMLVQTPLNM